MKLVLRLLALGDIGSEANDEWLMVNDYPFASQQIPEEFRPSPSKSSHFNTILNTAANDVPDFFSNQQPVIGMNTIQCAGSRHLIFGFKHDGIAQIVVPHHKLSVGIKQIK